MVLHSCLNRKCVSNTISMSDDVRIVMQSTADVTSGAAAANLPEHRSSHKAALLSTYLRNLSVQRSCLQYKSQCLEKVDVKYVINRL